MKMLLILQATTLLATALLPSRINAQQPACSAASFPLDLGNTHCEGFPWRNVDTPAECLAACCAEGDGCETWQWCEAGQSCANGYWSQSGTYGRGSDLDGWPQNTTVAVAEAACTASPACIGYSYSSSELHPGATKLKIYLKNNGTGPMADATWSR